MITYKRLCADANCRIDETLADNQAYSVYSIGNEVNYLFDADHLEDKPGVLSFVFGRPGKA